MDRISKQQRSKNMAAVKSRGNQSTEEKLAILFRLNKVKGWRRQYRKLPGTPDFAFPTEKLAVFVDGCFWHGCRYSSMPKTNKKFWMEKISSNKKRDQKVNRMLKSVGWKSIRLCEFLLQKDDGKQLRRIISWIKNAES